MLNLPDGAWLGSYDREKLIDIWHRIKDYSNLFADDDMKDPEVYLKKFLDRHSVIIETDGGFMSVLNIKEGLKAEAHFCFWDKKLSARSELIKDCMVWTFLQFDLFRLETFVADYARAVRRFLEKRLGFTYEGTMRDALRHDGQLIDKHVYSILREEVLNG
jgi:hypothetical protein